MGDDNLTALYHATANGHIAVGKLLLEVGASLQIGNQSRGSVLHRPVAEGHEAIVQLLLDNGGDVLVNTADSVGKTPLHEGASCENLAVVQALVDGGANMEAKDLWGQKTPLWYAITHDRLQIAKLLIDRGANIRSANEADPLMTTLHAVAKKGKIGSVRLLVENGADINVRDSTQSTPLSYAAARGSLEVVEFLLNYGADPLHSMFSTQSWICGSRLQTTIVAWKKPKF